MNLKNIYESRIKGLKTDTVRDLEIIGLTSERELYFVLVYFWLTNKDLSEYNLLSSLVVRLCIENLCDSSEKSSIGDYYEKYIDVKESSQQVDKILREINMASSRRENNFDKSE